MVRSRSDILGDEILGEVMVFDYDWKIDYELCYWLQPIDTNDLHNITKRCMKVPVRRGLQNQGFETSPFQKG
jgi:hypothetical protein